jgi:hydrogenase maturation protease
VVESNAIVLGIGNLLNTDEGMGIHAVRRLEEQLGESNDDLQFVDGGTLGLNLLPLIEAASHVLLLDCVDAGRPPGTVIELAKDQIPLYSGVKMSLHQTTFQEVLGLAEIRHSLPHHLHLIGVQPANLSVGVELSPIVADQLPEVVKRAKEILAGWGILPASASG